MDNQQQPLELLRRNGYNNGDPDLADKPTANWWEEQILKAKDPMRSYEKLTGLMRGVGSIPDVLTNTNNPLDALTIGPRYAGNIISGLADSIIPFKDPTQFKSTSDLMKKHNFTTGNEWGDLGLGLAGDLALDPAMYMGGLGLTSKMGKGGKLAAGLLGIF